MSQFTVASCSKQLGNKKIILRYMQISCYAQAWKQIVICFFIFLKDSDGDTALHCAAIAGKIESVTILLDAKADPIILNKRGHTPIHLAAKRGFTL